MRHLVYEKENSEFKPVNLGLKIDLVSYPARAEGLVNMVITKSLISDALTVNIQQWISCIGNEGDCVEKGIFVV